MTTNQAQAPTRKKNIGFVELTDEALDIFSHYTQTPEWDVVLVVSQFPDSYPVRMAEILQIPMLDVPNRLALLSCDRVIVGERPASMLATVREMVGGTEVEVVTLDDALAELNIERTKETETETIGAELKMSALDDGVWDWEEISLGGDGEDAISEDDEGSTGDGMPGDLQASDGDAAPAEPFVDTEPIFTDDDTESIPTDEDAAPAEPFVDTEPIPTDEDAAPIFTDVDTEPAPATLEVTPFESDPMIGEPEAAAVRDEEPAPHDPVVEAATPTAGQPVTEEPLAMEPAPADPEPVSAPAGPEPVSASTDSEPDLEPDAEPPLAEPAAETKASCGPQSDDGRLWFDTATLLGNDVHNTVGALPFHEREMEALRQILRLAVRATHAQTGSIMLLDEDGEHLRIAVAEGLPEDIVARGRRRKTEGVAGAVFTEGKPRIVRGRLPGSVDPAIRPALREAACVPIMSEGKAIGTLNVNMETEGDPLGERVIPLLARFAKEASAAILKAIDISDLDKERRLDALLRQVDRLMALNDSLPGRLHTVAGALGNAFGADFVHFLVVDPLGRRLELRSPPRGITSWQTRSQPMDRGLFGLVVREGAPQILEITGREESSRAAVICLPVGTTRPHGLVVLENAALDHITRDEAMDLLTETVAHVESIIEVELGVEAQELLYQLQMRVADQIPQLEGLPPVQRARGALEFCVDLLAGEVAIWVPRQGSRLITSQPHTPQATGLLAQARGSLDLLAEWVRDQGAVAGGAEAPGWNPKAPRGPAPYVGVTSADEEGVLLLFFSPEESIGSPAQVETHALVDILNRVSVLCSPHYEPENVQAFTRDRNTVPQPDATHSVTDFRSLIQHEWIRSRRYGHAFGLTCFRLPGQPEDSACGDLKEFLMERKRDVDLLTEVRPGTYVVLSPEVGHSPEGIARRLTKIWSREHPDLEFEVDQRIFPRDGQAADLYLNWVGKDVPAEDAA